MRKAPTDDRAKSSPPIVRRTETRDTLETNAIQPSIEIWDCATFNLTDWLRENGTWQPLLKKPRV
ncbi:hypothetical protein ACVIHH_003793 [Bradyrhizobium sp. USDA 4518]|nr:hypothetical protein [Bradyrhizobium sp. USDA 4545]MCP1850501.1 hypothetical protein [Bradyrhizobium sp. USDA 4541]MCP1914429.1 hypothetical protein [Bradyrhizobium elkanii]MCP1916416.1 hypothetical protein [Bradyrhizobium sp. USDA 4532]